MSRATLLVLFLLTCGLGALVYWQSGREQSGVFDVDEPLVVGLDPSRVYRLRVDNVERGLVVQMERDRSGRWFLVDPIAYPAERSAIEHLLEAVMRNRAVALEGAKEGDKGLSPPRAVVEVTERLPEGDRLHRIEIGSVDLDRNHVSATDGSTYLHFAVQAPDVYFLERTFENTSANVNQPDKSESFHWNWRTFEILSQLNA